MIKFIKIDLLSLPLMSNLYESIDSEDNQLL